jgi:hypothetical protein
VIDWNTGWAKTQETSQPADRGAIEQHGITFWRRPNRNGAKWVTRGVECLQKPPFATGTYPAWYTAALRTSAQFPGDSSPEDGTPESDITHDTFRFRMQTSARAARHRLTLVNVQGGSDDRGRGKTSGPSH